MIKRNANKMEEEYYTLKNIEEIEKYHFPHHKFSCLLVFGILTAVLSLAVVTVTIVIIWNRRRICRIKSKLPIVYGLLFLSAVIFFTSIYVFKWNGKDE